MRGLSVRVRGVVQGVGFRPFVHQLAERHRLAGWVRNTAGQVEIELDGREDALARFLSDLRREAPRRWPGSTMSRRNGGRRPASARS